MRGRSELIEKNLGVRCPGREGLSLKLRWMKWTKLLILLVVCAAFWIMMECFIGIGTRLSICQGGEETVVNRQQDNEKENSVAASTGKGHSGFWSKTLVTFFFLFIIVGFVFGIKLVTRVEGTLDSFGADLNLFCYGFISVLLINSYIGRHPLPGMCVISLFVFLLVNILLYVSNLLISQWIRRQKGFEIGIWLDNLKEVRKDDAVKTRFVLSLMMGLLPTAVLICTEVFLGG